MSNAIFFINFLLIIAGIAGVIFLLIYYLGKKRNSSAGHTQPQKGVDNDETTSVSAEGEDDKSFVDFLTEEEVAELSDGNGTDLAGSFDESQQVPDILATKIEKADANLIPVMLPDFFALKNKISLHLNIKELQSAEMKDFIETKKITRREFLPDTHVISFVCIGSKFSVEFFMHKIKDSLPLNTLPVGIREHLTEKVFQDAITEWLTKKATSIISKSLTDKKISEVSDDFLYHMHRLLVDTREHFELSLKTPYPDLKFRVRVDKFVLKNISIEIVNFDAKSYTRKFKKLKARRS